MLSDQNTALHVKVRIPMSMEFFETRGHETPTVETANIDEASCEFFSAATVH